MECVHSSRDDDSRGTGQVVRVFVCRLFLVISLRSDDLFFFSQIRFTCPSLAVIGREDSDHL